jgi:predicted nucleic acid-binding protein
MLTDTSFWIDLLGENDNWTAATARVWGLRLVTRDAAFARVPKLTVVSY